jgi:DNA invertase Pin-like site-specific DNA recombinase
LGGIDCPRWRRRKFDLLIVWKLDRLGRSLRHLILTLDELHDLNIGFVSLTEALDTTTPAGRFQMQILGAVAEFERGMIRERVVTGLARAKAQGVRLGRRRAAPLPQGAPRGLTVRQAAKLWGCSKSTAADRLRAGQLPPTGQTLKTEARI